MDSVENENYSEKYATRIKRFITAYFKLQEIRALEKI